MGGVRCARAGCRGWAMRGGGEWCRAHAPLLAPLGAPPGNQHARTHGAFSRLMPQAEAMALLAAALGDPGAPSGEGAPLEDALALCRAVLREVLAADDPLPPARASAVWAGLRALVALKLAQHKLTAAQSVGLDGEMARILTGLGLGVPGTDGGATAAGLFVGAAGADPPAVQAALATFLLDLHALGNPALLAKGDEVRAALAQPQPDVGHLVELRRYFAGRPRAVAVPAARFFSTPAVAALLARALDE